VQEEGPQELARAVGAFLDGSEVAC